MVSMSEIKECFKPYSDFAEYAKESRKAEVIDYVSDNFGIVMNSENYGRVVAIIRSYRRIQYELKFIDEKDVISKGSLFDGKRK